MQNKIKGQWPCSQMNDALGGHIIILSNLFYYWIEDWAHFIICFEKNEQRNTAAVNIWDTFNAWHVKPHPCSWNYLFSVLCSVVEEVSFDDEDGDLKDKEVSRLW